MKRKPKPFTTSKIAVLLCGNCQREVHKLDKWCMRCTAVLSSPKGPKTSIRFHLERRVGRGLTPADDVWTRETLAGAKTISRSRFDLRTIRKVYPHFKRGDWRTVKVTTTTEIVT